MTWRLLLDVMRLLVDAGAAERLSPNEMDVAAADIATACEATAPTLPPHGRTCAEVAVAIWGVETGYSWSLYPRATSGCGVGQVLAVPGLTRPCAELRVPRVGFAWLVTVYRWKLARVGSERAALRAYNGSPLRVQYERAVGAALRRLRRANPTRAW